MSQELFITFLTSAQLDLYADDTTVTAFADVKNLATLSSSLNKSVSEIQLWASANKLPLNEDKTKVLTITGKRCVANINGSDIDVFVNGKQLSNVDYATLLGVEIDSKLSFDEHTEKVCKCMTWYRTPGIILPFSLADQLSGQVPPSHSTPR